MSAGGRLEMQKHRSPLFIVRFLLMRLEFELFA